MPSTATTFSSDCVLMLHCEGSDGSTTATDSSFTNTKTLTAAGNAQVDTAQFKFGSASLLFDGTGDWFTAPDDPDWDMGTGDFTVDLWVRFAALAAGNFYDMISVGCRNEGPRIEFGVASSILTVYLENVQYDRAWSPSIDTWYHIAVIRTGSTVRIFVDGTQMGADITQGGDLSGGTDGLTVGARSDCSGNRSLPLNGWLDEVRVVKGTAVWTTNFTPPAAAYTEDASSIKKVAGVAYASIKSVSGVAKASIKKVSGVD